MSRIAPARCLFQKVSRVGEARERRVLKEFAFLFLSQSTEICVLPPNTNIFLETHRNDSQQNCYFGLQETAGTQVAAAQRCDVCYAPQDLSVKRVAGSLDTVSETSLFHSACCFFENEASPKQTESPNSERTQ